MHPGELWRRLRSWLRRDRMLSELEEEMRLHVELRAGQLYADGAASPLNAARRRFGNEAYWVEQSREVWGSGRADAVLQDLRYAMRSLRSGRLAGAAIVLTLAVTLGASTTIFGAVYRLYLRRLALPDAAELAGVQPFQNGRLQLVNSAEYLALARAQGVPQVAAYKLTPLVVESAAGRDDVWGDLVSANYFAVLRAAPLAGRPLLSAEINNAVPVTVISHELAARHFASAAAAVGKSLRIGGHIFTIVGVMPPHYTGVHFARRFAVALPLSTAQLVDEYAPNAGWQLIARVTGDERARAEAALDAAYRHCCAAKATVGDSEEAVPEVAGRFRARPSTETPTGTSKIRSQRREAHVVLADASRGIAWGTDYRQQYATVLLTVALGVLILVLIACANIATLLTARGVARERELAVRRAIGAGTRRLVRQLLMEGALLGCLGAACGFVLARLATLLLVRNIPERGGALAHALGSSAAMPMLLIMAACTIICVLLFALWPALQSARTDLVTPLSGSRNSGRQSLRGGRSLVVIQVALAVVLVCSASLFVMTVRNLLRNEVAVATSQLLIANVNGRDTEFRELGSAQLSERILPAVAGVAGVAGAAATIDAPFVMDMIASGRLEPPTEQPPEWKSPLPIRINLVTSGYFDVAGIPLRSGREFTEHDHADTDPVAVVSEQFARIYFGTRDPVGQTLRVVARDGRTDIQIVGVAADVPYEEPRAGMPAMWYAPLSHASAFGFGANQRLSLNVLVRTRDDATESQDAVRNAMLSAVPGLGIYRLNTASAILNDAIARERFAAVLAMVFGIVALFLTAAGVYALLSHTTARRTRELGVRVALGATPHAAAGLVLRQSMILVAAGVAAGTLITVVAARGVRSQLFGVEALDPRYILGAGALLLLISLLASLSPALRAAHVQPLDALRSE